MSGGAKSIRPDCRGCIGELKLEDVEGAFGFSFAVVGILVIPINKRMIATVRSFFTILSSNSRH
jgi:hypothetical protein